MTDNQFPVLSFQDGLNLLQSEQCETGPPSILEARNAAPFLRDYSPTNHDDDNSDDPTAFKSGPIDLLNTPSPKKIQKEIRSGNNTLPKDLAANSSHNAGGICKSSSDSCGIVATSTEPIEGKKHRRRKANGDIAVTDSQVTPNVKNDVGSSGIVMRFSDIRSGLNQATLSSSTSSSEMLHSRPMYKNISKTLFSEPDNLCEMSEEIQNENLLEIKPGNQLGRRSERVTVKDCLLSTYVDRPQWNDTQQSYPVVSGQLPQANKRVNYHEIPITDKANTFLRQQQSQGVVITENNNSGTNAENSNIGMRIQSMNFHSSQAVGDSDEQRRAANLYHPSVVDTNAFETPGNFSWYPMYPTPESTNNSNSSMSSSSTPQSRPFPIPECTATYTPASLSSETGSTTLNALDETCQQFGFSGRKTYNPLEIRPIQMNQTFQDPGLQQATGNPGYFVNLDNMTNQNQFVAEEMKRQATASMSEVVASYPTGIQNLNGDPRMQNHYFMPVSAVTSPPSRLNRKRKLVFEHIPTQQSSLRERIRYWEREGSLRTAGDPGLPGSSTTKISKEEPGVIYCDTPPTEDEWNESEELYGAPKVLKMNEVKVEQDVPKDSNKVDDYAKPRMTIDSRYSSCYQTDAKSPEVIEIQDEEEVDNTNAVNSKFEGDSASTLFDANRFDNRPIFSEQYSHARITPADAGSYNTNQGILSSESFNVALPNNQGHGVSSSSQNVNHSMAYSPQTVMMQNLLGIPTPPTAPLLATQNTQQPLVQVLQFNPRLLHIQSLNVGGTTPMQALANSGSQAQPVIPQSYANAANTYVPPRTEQTTNNSNVMHTVPFSMQTMHTTRAAAPYQSSPSVASAESVSSTFTCNDDSAGIIAQPFPALAPTAPRNMEMAPAIKSESKTMRPKYFDISTLQIGSFSIFNQDPSTKKKIVLKLMFGKRKMVYEYELSRTDEDRDNKVQPIVSIEIPFGTIVGLKGFERILVVEVNIRPVIHYGLKKLEGHLVSNMAQCYEQNRLNESSNEQIMSVPYHEIQFRMPVAEKVKALLCASDSRFEIIQSCPLILMPSKVLARPQKKLPSPPPQPRNLDTKPVHILPSDSMPIQELQNCVDKCSTGISQPSAHQSLQDIVKTSIPVVSTPKHSRARVRPPACSCTKGCRTTRCRCVIHQQECGPWCACHKQDNCHNMLNQLADEGVDVDEAKQDPCLLANLSRISNLKKFLKQEVLLSCCNRVVPLRHCIPGKITCPGGTCSQVYFFSWCRSSMCEEGNSFTKHCEDCKGCTEIDNQHCNECRICHEPLPPNQPCPYNSPKKAFTLSSNPQRTPDSHDLDYISCGPLRSESYGKYVIGSEPLGQKIKKLQEIDMIESLQSVAGPQNSDASPDFTKVSESEVNHIPETTPGVCSNTGRFSNDEQGVVNERCIDASTHGIDYKSIQSMNADIPVCESKPTAKLYQLDSCKFGDIPLNSASSCHNFEDFNLFDFGEKSISEIDSQTAVKPSETRVDSVADKDVPPEPPVETLTQKKRRPPARSKVSLLAQLLESESDTETKILPKLLDTDEKSKSETKAMEEKMEKCSGSEIGENKDNNTAKHPELMTVPGNTSTNFIDGVLSYSDADEMLNMINMQELPDNLFNVDIPDDVLNMNIECQQAIESMGITADVNNVFTNENNLQMGQQQASLEFDFEPERPTAEDTKSPEIVIHPHSDGVVQDFPDSFVQASSMTSPAMAHSLGKILGRPLNTSSPIPK